MVAAVAAVVAEGSRSCDWRMMESSRVSVECKRMVSVSVTRFGVQHCEVLEKR